MASDSAEVDAALVAKLLADATLKAMVPDGIYVDVASKNATRFVVISQLAHDDNYMFGGEAYERFEYSVKAVDKNLSGINADNAAARIRTLLQDVTLTINGYTSMVVQRLERIAYREADADNADLRWQHRGGRYEILASPNP